ncbi:MAG TPA: polyprenyl synthetase family protein [Nitrososphaeraceae archaeon]|nr:polyprenyl synthetase family protein [Nitrososphaeraceae archaeon]
MKIKYLNGDITTRKNTNQKSSRSLMEQFGDYLLKINNTLERELDLYSWSEFYSSLKYACEGGKRIRPLILILSSEIIKSKKDANLFNDINMDYSKMDDKRYLSASAVELLHTESVIHDDIIDEENLRRGKPSFHIKYGYNNSILTADFVLGIILNITSKLNNPRISSEIANAAIRMSEGEIMEIRLNNDNSITEDDYIKVLENKTASLFETSTRIGAILAEADEDDIRAMGNFGHLMGIAYQIHDDLQDWNNEDRLFNLLMKQNNHSQVLINKMELLYKSYSIKARNELNLVLNNIQNKYTKRLKSQLEELTNLNIFPT